MKRYINRILLAVAALFAMAGTAKAAADLDLKNDLSTDDATVAWYISDGMPTADNPGTAATPGTTKAEAGKYLVIQVTPKSGHFTYNELLTFQPVGGTGGAEARQRSVILPANPTALSTNSADGTGYYYYQIPATCTNANGYTKVVLGGSVIEKIDLTGATLSGSTITTAARTDGWQAVITLDQVSFTYSGSAQGPTISSFSLKNGTNEFSSTIADHVTISGNSQTNASTTAYNATLTAVATGCLKNSCTAAFNIVKKTLTITAKPQSVNYGTAITQGTDQVTVEGLVSGQTLTAITLTQSTTDVTTTGTITPSAATVKSGDTDVTVNYDITYSPGTLTVNQKAVTATVTAANKVYDGTTTATLTTTIETGVTGETLTARARP